MIFAFLNDYRFGNHEENRLKWAWRNQRQENQRSHRNRQKMRTNGNLASGGVGGSMKPIQEMFYWHFLL